MGDEGGGAAEGCLCNLFFVAIHAEEGGFVWRQAGRRAISFARDIWRVSEKEVLRDWTDR